MSGVRGPIRPFNSRAWLHNTQELVPLEATLTLDTAAYADGDVLAAPQEIQLALADGDKASLAALSLWDFDKQGSELDLLFLRSAINIGVENANVAIADADGPEVLHVIRVVEADYVDLGGFLFADLGFHLAGSLLYAPSGITSLYIAAVSRAVCTHSVNGLRVRLGLARGQ